MVDQHPQMRLRIAKKIGVGFIIGIFVSYITRTLLLMPVVASLASYALIESVFTKPRVQRISKKAKVTVEPILYNLSKGLREGLSPERAFQLYARPESEGSQIACQMGRATENGQPLPDVLDLLTAQVSSEGERRILSSISDALTENPRRAGQTLFRSMERIQRNRELRAERTLKIRSLLFRVKVLSVTCSTTLALIVALLPVLSWINITRDWPQTATVVTQGSSWIAAIVLSLTSGISSYYAASVALAKRPFLYAVSSLTIFWIVFLTASQLAY